MDGQTSAFTDASAGMDLSVKIHCLNHLLDHTNRLPHIFHLGSLIVIVTKMYVIVTHFEIAFKFILTPTVSVYNQH
jgi:hypothetical protein